MPRKLIESAYIARGFKEDVKELLHDFRLADTIDATVFTEIWKKHHFSLVFYGRDSGKEMKEFTEEILRITLNLLSESSDIVNSAGVIYTLYGLYLKQRSVPKVKIRVKMDQWEVIIKLLQTAIRENYVDLRDIIRELYHEKAFEYTCTTKLCGPLTSFSRYHVEESINTSPIDLASDWQIILDTGLFEALDEVHEAYVTAKSFIPDNDTDLERVVENQFKDMSACVNSLASGEIGKADLPSSFENLTEENIGFRRANLKKKQFERHISHYTSPDTAAEEEEVDAPKVEETKPVLATPSPKKSGKFKKKKEKRTVGRPKKHVEVETAESSDDENMLVFAESGEKLGRRKHRHYYDD